MATDDVLGAEKTDGEFTSEGEKPPPKEHFTVEGSELINIK